MNLSDFLIELNKQVSGELRTDEYSRLLYSTDASLYQVVPHGVLIPRHVADVQAAVTLAAKYQVPLLPRAGGSSLAGQAVNAALVMDFTRHLDQVLELNVAERWVRVQPGIVLDALNATLKPHGLQFGPDPASSNRAAMGGIISNNATGSHSILYGMAADHLLGMNVLLNDGSEVGFSGWDSTELNHVMQEDGRLAQITRDLREMVAQPANQAIIRRDTPRHWRRCGGYNLDRMVTNVTSDLEMAAVTYKQPPRPGFNLAALLCGAEGTLGVITELKLSLVPLPAQTAVAVLGFATTRAALTAVPALLETNPSAVELLDNRQLLLCRQNRQYDRLLKSFIEGEPYCLLITEYYGTDENELQAHLTNLQHHVKKQGIPATTVTPILDPVRQQNVWQIRKGGLGLLMSLRGDTKPVAFIEDSAVPVAHLPEYVDKLTDFCAELDTELAIYAHASAGCLHIRPLMDSKKAAEVAKMPRIASFAADLLKGAGGALSSEHGDGRARSWLNESFYGPELYGLYRQVKQIFDPNNIFNPGNIIDGGPMTENLRFGAAYEVIPLQTQLDFREDQGFHRAIEMCNGAGICRKRTTGAMCPSFMATREEAHSTRGRANALRAALSGQMPPSEFTSPRMYDVMSLCVSCKACKSECPSSVDMARIKSEFLAHYHKEHGIPLRDRALAHIDRLSRLGSGPLTPLINWSLGNGMVRRGLQTVAGIAAERELSPFARQRFSHWFRRRLAADSDGLTPSPVLLFSGTFVEFNYPEIGIAATELLEAAGQQVTIPRVTDSGRPAFSKGLIAAARTTAVKVLAELTPYARQNMPIICLEPSDLSMFIDDFTALLPDDPRVPLLASCSVSLEQYIASQSERDQLPLDFTDAVRQVILHGHCHQKALTGTAATRQVLALPPNYSVTELDTSCCGMAGSFGYERAYQDVSRKMGERHLFPAIRQAEAATLIVAPGVSCRQQIRHGTQRRAYHPAELLRDALR